MGMHLKGVESQESVLTNSEGFCEDLARQNTAARLFQLQLGFRRCRMGFYTVAYGFQSSSWCPKTTI
jgi:hypothetical protein